MNLKIKDMKAILTTLILVSVFAVQLVGQSLGTAVYYSTADSEKTDFGKYYNKVLKADLQKDSELSTYTWKRAENAAYIDDGTKRKPYKKVVYIQNVSHFSDIGAITFKRDTSGRVVGAKYKFNANARSLIKTLDLATSEIVHMEVYDATSMSLYSPPKWKDYLTSDPDKFLARDAKKYKEAVLKLKKKSRAEILDILKKDVDRKVKAMPLPRLIAQSTDDRIFEVTPNPSFKGKKLKEVEVILGDLPLKKGEELDIYRQVVLEGATYYEHITDFKVESVGDGTAVAKSNTIFGRKALAKAMQNNEKIIAAPDAVSKFVHQLGYGKKPKVNVTLKKSCNLCSFDRQKSLMDKPCVRLIEREASLKYFQNILKSEKYIDYPLDELQGKQLGAEILVTMEENFINGVDIATNREIYSEKNDIGFFNAGIQPDEYLYKILSQYRPDDFSMQIVSILDQKKKKVRRLLIYHPVNMPEGKKFNIVKREKEEVDGEVLYRSVKIGDGRVRKKLSTNLGELKVGKGKKDIKKELDNGTTLYLEYIIK